MNINFESVLTLLGEPFYRENNVAIYNMDCLIGLEKIPNNTVHLTITSPPYNIGKEYETLQEVDQYVEWCIRWLKKISTKTTLTGAFWLNVGYLCVKTKGKNVPIAYLLWDKCEMFLQQEIVWNYEAGVACRNYLSPRNEKLLWFVKDENEYCFNLDEIRDTNVKYPNQTKNGKLRCNPNGKNPSDVWKIPKVTSGRACEERTKHPAQFPLEMIERIVKGFSNQNEIILDPFCGSGTTALAAKQNNRYFIGFEINKDYCEIAKNRLCKKRKVDNW